MAVAVRLSVAIDSVWGSRTTARKRRTRLLARRLDGLGGATGQFRHEKPRNANILALGSSRFVRGAGRSTRQIHLIEDSRLD
jgi:hypothetical protein